MKKLKELLIPVLFITLGAAVYALGFVWCYQPNAMASGGVTGIAQIIHFLFPAIPVGVTVIVLNIPLFVLGFRFIGARLLAGSLYAMFISSVIIDIITPMFSWQPMDPFLACIFGGVTMGLSLGLVIGQGSTTGGTDLLARLLKLKFQWLSMGKLLLVIDLGVILAVSVVFGELTAMLYGLIALFLSSVVMDWVLYGTNVAKVAYIISDRNEEICHTLVHGLDRGVTVLHGRGGYSGSDKQVLMCAFNQREIADLKAAVKDIDPDAFLIVCNTHEVLGEGFLDYKKNDI